MTNPNFTSIERKRNYLTLDGIRGVAALAVVSRHFLLEMTPIELPGSYLAVDIFFAMSGFVLAHSYDSRLGVDLSVGGFLKKRLIRLYPLYFISILIVALGVAAALVADVHLNWGATALTLSLVLSLLFLPTPQGLTNSSPLFPLNGPAWSLFMEMAVNIVYAVVRPLLSSRVLNLVLVGSGIALGLAIAWHGDADIGSEWPTFAISPPRVLFSFFLGVAIHRWDRAGKLPHIPLPAWSILLVMLLIFAGAFTGMTRVVFDLAAVLVLLPALLIAGIQNQPTRFKRAFTFLGVTSYPIYVLHVPLQKYIEGGIGRALGGHIAPYAPFVGLIILAAMLPIGWVANRYIDAPVRQWLSQTLAGGRRRIVRAHEA